MSVERAFLALLLAPALVCLGGPARPSMDFGAEVYKRIIPAMDDGRPSSFEIPVSRSRTMTVRVDATTKGNGGIKIGNVYVRVLDMHDDGFAYEDDTLLLELVPPGLFRDAQIVVCGVGRTTDENGTVTRVPLHARLRFDSRTGEFVMVEQVSPIEIAWLTSR
jgi:hypothetical protein